MSPAPRRAAAAALAVALTAAGAARAADLYGKPLRGLSPVAVADVAAHPHESVRRATGRTQPHRPASADTSVTSRGGIRRNTR